MATKISNEQMQALVNAGKAKPIVQQKSVVPEKQGYPIVQGEEQPSDIAGKIIAGGSGALQGASFGLADPVLAAGAAGVQEIGEALGMSEPKDVSERYKEQAAMLRAKREQYPEYAIPAEIGGAFVSPIGNKLSASFKAAGIAPKALKFAEGVKASEKVLPIAKEVAKGALNVGGQAAVGSLGYATGEKLTGAPVHDPKTVVGVGAGLGAGVEAAKYALPPVGKAVASAGKSALALATGTDKPFVERFLKDGKNIVNARTPEKLTNIIKKVVNKSQVITEKDEESLAAMAVQAVEELKSKVSDMSTESYQILENSGKRFKKSDLIRSLEESKQRLAVYDQPIYVGAYKTALNKVDELVDFLRSTKMEKGLNSQQYIGAPEAKRLIQTLDDLTRYSDNAGEFDPVLDKMLKEVRRGLDQKVKAQVPEYAKKMSQVEFHTKALNEMKDLYGDSKSALDSVKRISQEIKGGREKAFLGESAGVSGRDDFGNIYPREEGKYRKLLTDYADVHPEIYEDKLNRIRELKSLENWSNEGTIHNKLNSFVNLFNEGKPANVGFKKMVSSLGIISDANFDKLLQQAADRVKYDNIGSNKNLFQALSYYGGPGFTVAYMSGAPLGLSVALSGISTVYGPPVAKKVLTELASMQGSPTVAKISKMDLPAPLRQQLKDNLVSFLAPLRHSDEDLTVPDMQSGKEIKGYINKNPDPVSKAKQLTQLYKDKTVNSKVMSGYILGDHPMPNKMVEAVKNNFDVIGDNLIQAIRATGLPGADVVNAPKIQKIDMSGAKDYSQFTDEDILNGSYVYPESGKRYARIIRKAEEDNDIPPGLLSALIEHESGFSPTAKSPTGALGLGQFVKKTAEEMGLIGYKNGKKYDNRTVPEKAIPAAAEYLARKYGETGSWIGALASYNSGFGAYSEAKGDIGKMRQEAQDYVPAVVSKLKKKVD